MSCFIRVRLCIVGLLISLSFIGAVHGSVASIRSATLGSDAWPEVELTQAQMNRQLQLHFVSVLQILLANHDNSLDECVRLVEENSLRGWTVREREHERSQLTQSRLRHVAKLVDYANRGRFPINDRYQAPTPIFVDDHHTHCAVGYLVANSGAQDVVDVVRRSNNLIRVMDVTDGALHDWIIRSGLTQAEAALIQPAYPCDHATVVGEFIDGEVHEGTVVLNVDIKGLAGIEARSLGGFLSLETLVLNGVDTGVPLRSPFSLRDGVVVDNSPTQVVLGVLGADKRIDIEGTTTTSILYSASPSVAKGDLTVSLGIGDDSPTSLFCPEPTTNAMAFFACIVGIRFRRRRRKLASPHFC